MGWLALFAYVTVSAFVMWRLSRTNDMPEVSHQPPPAPSQQAKLFALDMSEIDPKLLSFKRMTKPRPRRE